MPRSYDIFDRHGHRIGSAVETTEQGNSLIGCVGAVVIALLVIPAWLSTLTALAILLAGASVVMWLWGPALISIFAAASWRGRAMLLLLSAGVCAVALGTWSFGAWLRGA